MRFVAAQFGALMQDDLWRDNAVHANAMATAARRRRAAPLLTSRSSIPSRPTRCSPGSGLGHIATMQREWAFHIWDERESVVRWMTAFDTSEADVDAFIAGPARHSHRLSRQCFT